MTDQTESVVSEEDPKLYLAPATLRNCFLAWFFPGLGYWLAGRKRVALIVATCLFGGFLLGVLNGGDLFPFAGEGKIRTIGAFCQMGVGIPHLLALLFLERGTPLSSSYDYGTNYFLIVGMLNWLMVLDTFDISVKRK